MQDDVKDPNWLQRGLRPIMERRGNREEMAKPRKKRNHEASQPGHSKGVIVTKGYSSGRILS